MKLKKQSILFLILALFSYSLLAFNKPPVTATNNTGIVFVHGTNDHRSNALGGYWRKDFINSIVSGLPNPENYFIVHCDFRHYMWHENSAGCFADQVSKFIKDKNIDDLLVITHSDGANVMRWLLSNPSYDSRYPKIIDTIRWVDAIAPSSQGTILADDAIDGTIFEEALGWLLGYKSNSVKQQRIGDMAIYNDSLLDGSQGRASLSKPLYTIIGTDVTASPLNSNSYCGGYKLNLALKVTRLFLDSCADGFLNCSSQTAAGTVWFYDKDKTSKQVQLSHNQSRSKCFGLDQILISDI